MSDNIFVFGSNTAGRHGKGAALFARNHKGAVYGQGRGLQGSSYAIPTKDHNLNTRDVEGINDDVADFLMFARNNPQLTFEVTKVGCGLAGIPENIMKAMFLDCPDNCILPEGWDDKSS